MPAMCSPVQKRGDAVANRAHSIIWKREKREKGPAVREGGLVPQMDRARGELGRGEGSGRVRLCEHAILAKAPPHLQLWKIQLPGGCLGERHTRCESRSARDQQVQKAGATLSQPLARVLCPSASLQSPVVVS